MGLTSSQSEQAEQMLKLKYLHGEKEVPLSEATILAQKGLNYERLQEKLQQIEQDPRLSFVESLAKENDMTIDEFIESFNFERQQAEIEELVQNNIPKGYYQEMIKKSQFRDQFESERMAREQKAQQDQEFFDFFEQYRALNGQEFDASKGIDAIPSRGAPNE